METCSAPPARRLRAPRRGGRRRAEIRAPADDRPCRGQRRAAPPKPRRSLIRRPLRPVRSPPAARSPSAPMNAATTSSPPSINGRSVPAMVDTGATSVALTAETARKLGLFPPRSAYTVRISTANGEGLAAEVSLDEIRIGPVAVRDIPAIVVQEGALGRRSSRHELPLPPRQLQGEPRRTRPGRVAAFPLPARSAMNVPRG